MLKIKFRFNRILMTDYQYKISFYTILRDHIQLYLMYLKYGETVLNINSLLRKLSIHFLFSDIKNTNFNSKDNKKENDRFG